ncbi:MAG: hypothetical protein OXH30_03355 [Chloroflexi bacterium]|nr:hypothetical protein [Chloroflexota bacterium]
MNCRDGIATPRIKCGATLSSAVSGWQFGRKWVGVSVRYPFAGLSRSRRQVSAWVSRKHFNIGD